MSNETDLDWLARVTCGTLEPWCEFIARSGCDSWACTRVFDLERDWFTRAQYLTRCAELQNKPSWKDAPEWATHMAQRHNGRWLFLRYGELGEVTWKADKISDCKGPSGEVLGDWRDTLERRPEAAK